MGFEYYKTPVPGLLAAVSGHGEWRWRYRAANGKIISSGESYVAKQDCLHAIGLLMDTNRATPVIETAN